MKIAVVALGGNALHKKGEKLSISSQVKVLDQALECILDLLKEEYKIIITHGNAIQVGNILIRVEEALGKAYNLPLEVCVAESEGEMGYLIEQTLQNKLTQHHKKHAVISLLTQVIVDKHDPYFHRATKPIGPWYTKEQAELLQKKGQEMKEIEKGKFRRVVPSPRPVKIDDVKIIQKLLKEDVIVIAAGGGGIPVYEHQGKLKGIAAVIDKDLASACLAKDLKADLFLILTGVNKVALNYGKSNQKNLSTLTIGEAKQYMQEGHFPEGSMGPKIEAAINFLKHGGKKVIITSPARVAKALKGKEGTVIKK